MGLFGKLMDSMRINDDEYDDEYYDDEYEDTPKKSIFSKHDKYEDEIDDEPKQSLFSKNNKPVPVRRTMEVSMVKPNNVADARTITNFLLAGKAVVLNMEGIPTELAQRIIDFTSGATYGMDGKLQKISNFIFIATPSNVDLSGEFQDLLNSGSLDMSQGGSIRY